MGVTSNLPPGHEGGAESLAILKDDYHQTFSTMSGKRVLADLADHLGFYTVAPAGASDAALREMNAARAAFFRILQFVGMTPGEVSELEQSARVARVARLRASYNIEDNT